METIDNIDVYLPQYLSSEDKDALKKELSQFPTDGTKDTVYTSSLNGADYLLQGDGIAEMPYVNFPNLEMKKVKGILLSNTCDMSLDNKRPNDCRIMFAPILNFDKYSEMIRYKLGNDSANSHLTELKKQHVSQALFLPKGAGLEHDSVVFFDRAISLPLNAENVKECCKNKIFTLSNFGFYLLLLKISIHFTRVQEKVQRS